MKQAASLVLFAAAIGCGLAKADAQGSAAEQFQRSYDAEATGKLGDAVAALDAMPAAQQAGYVAQLRRGWLMYKLGKYQESIEAYGKAIAQEPRSVEARVGVLLPAMALRRWGDAEGGAKEVLRIDPANYLATLRMAFAVYNLGRYGESAAIYRKLAEMYPSDVEVRSGLGWALLKAGKTSEAAAEFRAVLEVAPRTPLAIEGVKAAR